MLVGGMKEASNPLNFTAVVPKKLEPLIVTFVPANPFVGENPVITGAA